MITTADYFGPWGTHPDVTGTVRLKAGLMLQMVNLLLLECGKLPVNPKTMTQISGEKYGGFRPMDCKQGAPQSSHKTGEGIDIYDPDNKLDEWLTDEILETYGLYREHPSKTPSWCHLSTRAPGSGRRTFMP